MVGSVVGLFRSRRITSSSLHDVPVNSGTGPSFHSAGVAVGVATGAGTIAGPGVAIMNAVGRPVLLLIVPGRRARRSALWQSSAPTGVPRENGRASCREGVCQ